MLVCAAIALKVSQALLFIGVTSPPSLARTSPSEESRGWTTAYTRFIPFLQILEEHTPVYITYEVGVVYIEHATFALKLQSCSLLYALLF